MKIWNQQWEVVQLWSWAMFGKLPPSKVGTESGERLPSALQHYWGPVGFFARHSVKHPLMLLCSVARHFSMHCAPQYGQEKPGASIWRKCKNCPSLSSKAFTDSCSASLASFKPFMSFFLMSSMAVPRAATVC